MYAQPQQGQQQRQRDWRWRLPQQERACTYTEGGRMRNPSGGSGYDGSGSSSRCQAGERVRPLPPFYYFIIILSSLSYLLSISCIYICIYCILMHSNCEKKEKKPQVQKVPWVSFDTV
jgi:hypothetical protein